MLPIGVVTGNDYRNINPPEEQHPACSGVNIQFGEFVFRNHPQDVKMQPDRYAKLFEQANKPGNDADVTG